MDLRTFAKSSGPPPNLPVPPGVIPNSVSQQLNNLRMTESSMSSMLRTQQEHGSFIGTNGNDAKTDH